MLNHSVFNSAQHRFRRLFDDNFWACAVSALILRLVVNLSPKMDSATRFPMGHGYFSCPTFFAYFVDFSLGVLAFNHSVTSGLKSNVII